MKLKDYLKDNNNIINSKSESIDELYIIDEDLKESEIFLTGENHGVKANIELRMKFLKYFKKKTNLKYYLWELPYSVTCFLNRYLETGNEKILKKVYEPLRGTYGWNKDEYNHWKDLHKLNKTFPKKDRIKVIGIDIEHQPASAFNFMEDFLDRDGISKGIIEDIEGFRNKEFENKKDIENKELKILALKIDDELNRNKKLYSNHLKEDYFRVKLVNDNLLNMLEVYSSNNFNDYRDKNMYENFIKLYENLPEGKYFGQLGLSHVFQEEFPYVTWFASFLNDGGSKFQDKILSIVYVYDNCRYLYPSPRRNYASTINTLDSPIMKINDFVETGSTLFKLNGEGSPYNEELIWPFKDRFPELGVTTDYFQYLVVIKDSKEMEEYEV